MPEHEPPRRISRGVDDAVAVVLILAAIVIGYRILLPLMPAILWGASLTVISAHPYERLARRLGGRRHLAAAGFGALYLFVLIVPAVFFAWELLKAAPLLLQFAGTLAEDPARLTPGWLSQVPLVGPDLAAWWADVTGDVSIVESAALRHLGQIAGWSVAQIGSFGAFVCQFILGAVVALFLLVNRTQVWAFLTSMLERVGGPFAVAVVAGAFDTMRSAFFGVIAAATAQAGLAAVAIWAAGLPNVVLFTGLTFLAALINIGPVVALILADAMLLARTDYLATALLTLWFLGVVMTIDNLIKPWFAGRGTRLPGLLAFLGGLGGILAWGLIGAYLGPALMSVLYQLARGWIATEPQAPAPGQDGTPRP